MSKSDDKTESRTETADLGAAQVQAKFDEANEKGYFGTVPDREPNESFTLAGVAKAKG